MQHISPSWHCERNTRRGPSHRLKTNLLHFAALLLIALSPRVGWAQTPANVSTFSDLKSKLEDNTTNYIITLTADIVWPVGEYNINVKGTKTLQSDGTRRTISRNSGNPYTGHQSIRTNSIVLWHGSSLTVNNVTFDGKNIPNCASMILVRRAENNNIYEAASLTMTNCTIKNCLLNYGMPLPSQSSMGQNQSAISSISGAAINFFPSTKTAASNYRDIRLTNCVFDRNRVTMLVSNNMTADNINGINALGSRYCNGGALSIADATGTNSYITGCTFTNNKAAQSGGAICFWETENPIIVSNCTIGGDSGNPNIAGAIQDGNNTVTKGGEGGGIYCIGGNVSFKNNTRIEHNIAYKSGGGIHIAKSKSFKFLLDGDSCIISNNKVRRYQSINYDTLSGNGGGIYIEKSNEILGVDIQYTKINNNQAYNGGAIYIDGDVAYPTPIFKYCRIGEKSNSNVAKNEGGGIYVNGSNSQFSNCEINYNYSQTRHGGGIYVNNSNATFNTCLIEGNYNDNGGYGGGVYCNVGSNSYITKFTACNIKNNGISEDGIETTDGGGAYLDGNVTLEGTTIQGNKATRNGGGVNMINNGCTLKSGCLVYENTAGNDGGGIYMQNGKILGESGANKIYGNTASNNGGGIYYENGTIQGNNYVYDNTATNNGGGLYVHTKGSTATNRTFDNLFVGTDGGSATDKGNKAVNGGGIYVENEETGITITLDACSIVHNKVRSGGTTINQGGGVYMSDASGTKAYTVKLAGGTNIQGNEALVGGGVYINQDVHALTLNLTNATLSGNKATTGDGGGIYNNKGTVLCESGCSFTFDGNKALAGSGGGIYNNSGTVECNNGSFTFDGNEALAGNGGGIYNAGGTLTLKGTDGGQIFKKNKAFRVGNIGGNGGGMYLNGGEADLKNCDVGIENTGTGDIRVNGNEANNGGGIFNDGTGSLKLDGTRVSYNTATQNGGGINHKSSTKLILKQNTTFLDNEAYVLGGGLYNNMVTTEIESATFSMNKAGLGGGGIYNKGGTVNGANSTTHFVGNEAINGNGGGIHNFGTLNLDGTTGTKTFTGNKAQNGGGIYNRSGKTGDNTCIFEFTMLKKNDQGDYVPDNSGIQGEIKIVWAQYGGGGSTSVRYINDTIVLYGFDVVDGLVLDVDRSKRCHLFAIYKPAPAEEESYDGTNRVLKVRLTNTDIGTVLEGELKDLEVPKYGDGVNDKYFWKTSSPDNEKLIKYPGCYTYSFHQLNTENGSSSNLNGVANLSNCTIGGSAANANKATNGHGGGIYIRNNSTANLENSNITNNEATRFGGGVYICNEAIMGVSGVVEVENNTTQRNTADYPYLKGSLEDDVCLQSLNWAAAYTGTGTNTNIGAGGNIGKIYVRGDITGSYIGITEEQIAIGPDNNVSNTDRLHNYEGDIHRQFTINYGTFYNAKNATEIFFSNDKILDIKRLYPGTNTLGQTVTSTTNLLEVTLGLDVKAWYVAGIWDDGNSNAPRYKWGLDHPDYGRFPDIPLRTLTGPEGVFARGYNPHTDHIFVVRAISIEEEAKVRTTDDDDKVVIRYPNNWNQNNFKVDDVDNSIQSIPNEEGSLEVTLHRYPGGHRLSSAFSTVTNLDVYDSNTSNSGGGEGVVPSAQAADSGTPTMNETLMPGPNIGPVVQMDASNTTILYDVHMDGLAEFDHVQNTSHNPQGFYISPQSALLAVEDVTYSDNTSPTGTITLTETCELLWNNNKYGTDNSKDDDEDDAPNGKFKREQRTGGAVFCAGTLVCEGTVIERNTCFNIYNTEGGHGFGGGIYVKPGGSVTLDSCIVGSEGDAGIDETNKNMAQYGGGIYIDNIPYSDNGTPDDESDDIPEKSGVVILTGQNAIQHNEATEKGGGVYKLGRLMIQDGTTNEDDKPLHITKNNIVSGTDENITYTLNNVHIPIESADDQTILITGALNCGSSIGVTKTKKWAGDIGYGTQGEHTYKNDKYFEEVNTPIAKVDSWEDDDNDPSTPSVLANQTWAEDAFYKRIFFDDKGYYRVWSFDFYNYGDGEDYSDQKDYFIETWRSYANNGTDHVELDNNNKLVKKVKSPQGFAYFAKQVNDGEDYSGVDLCQTTTIDLDGHHWEPIGYTFCGGCETEADRPFAGTYNGNGHFILNAVSILPEKEMGLFGNVTGTLKHTFTVGDDFSNTHDHTFNGHGFASLGAIVGNTTGIIDGCEAAKSLLHVHYHDNNAPIAAGGIAGNVGGTGEVRNSFTSHINFSEDKRQNGTITIAYGTFDHCGGLVGNIASGGKVKNCYTKVNGSAELFPESYAAIVGNNGNTQSGNFTNCYTSATEGAIVGSGTAGTNVYSAGATGATATYTAPIGADHLGYMCIDNGVPYSTCGLTTAQKENLIEGKDYFEFHDGNGNVTLIPLFRLLNLNAKALNNSNNYTPYAEWARPALAYYNSSFDGIERPVNGDLPLLMLNNYDGSTSPKIGQGGFRSVGTYGGPGDVLQYGGPDRDGNNNQLNAALIRAKVSNSFDDFLFVYGDVNVAPIAQCSTFTQAKVSIYEHAAVSSPGTLAGFDQTYVGITFDNSAQAGGSATNGINYIDNGPSLPRNWHMLSTPLTNAPLGFRYGGDADPHNKPIDEHTTYTNNYDAAGFFNNPWGNAEGSSDPNSPSNTEFSWLGNSDYATGHTRYWMHGWNNSRVAGTHDNSSYPASTWKDGYFPSKVNTSAIQFGAQLFIPFENNNGSNEYVNGNHRYPYGMDFYSWYEPKYHYINFKRNGPNHWHSNAPHVHLDYTPEEASNNSGATAFGQNVNETTLLDGKGYMASIHIPTFLQTSGSLGGSTKTIKVTYNENDLDLCEGWNLVGNPFHAYLDFNAFSSANSAVGNQYVVYNADGFGRPGNGNYGDGFSYYVVGGSQNGAYAGQYLHPHQGFFVKVGSSTTLNFAESQTVLRSQIGTSGSYRDDSRPAYPLVNLFLTSDKGCSDVCVVEFNRPEWGGATKLRDMYSGNGLFYAAHDDGSYAALFATPEAERIPLKFEAKDEAGDTYTIHWNTQNGDFHKLYLVDNITGVQYDMLRNSSYTFSGKKDDYWTRFYITFEVTGLDEEQDDEDDDASTGSASTTFAFFDGSQWVVTNDGHGTATLDLIDLQGRVLHSTTLAEGQARIGLPDVAKGMYLMRMTNQNGMFVQKIVVR